MNSPQCVVTSLDDRGEIICPNSTDPDIWGLFIVEVDNCEQVHGFSLQRGQVTCFGSSV